MIGSDAPIVTDGGGPVHLTTSPVLIVTVDGWNADRLICTVFVAVEAVVAGPAPATRAAKATSGRRSFFMTTFPLRFASRQSLQRNRSGKVARRITRFLRRKTFQTADHVCDGVWHQRFPVAAVSERLTHVGARNLLLRALIEDHDLVHGSAKQRELRPNTV